MKPLPNSFQVVHADANLANALYDKIPKGPQTLYDYNDKVAFRSDFLSSALVLWSDYAAIRVNNVDYGHKAQAHAYFFGPDTFRRVQELRDVAHYLMDYFELVRLEVYVPSSKRALGRLLKQIGFALEGVCKKDLAYEGTFLDAAIYAIVR